MALILNIETSTSVCAVALGRDGLLVDQIVSYEKMSHAGFLAQFAQTILERNQLTANDLDAVSVSEGPGSYTGLRIGVSTAKGLSFGIGKPLIAIHTLLSMAQGFVEDFAPEEDCLLVPMIDARRMEVYTAVFDTQLRTVESTHAKVIDADSFADLLANRKLIFFGDGAAKCAETLVHPNALFQTEYTISATSMVALSEAAFASENFADVAYFEPFYLKEFMVTTPKNKVIE